MTLSDLQSYATLHLQSIDAALHQHIHAFLAFVTGEEDRVKAEIAHLEALGYSVVKPAS